MHTTHQGSDDIEKISIGDDFDTSLFDQVKRIKNFLTVSFGCGMNDAWLSASKWIWSPPLSTTIINKEFCGNLGEYKHRFFWNNRCFNVTVDYNIVLSKHFVFLIFGKVIWKNFFLMTNTVSFEDIVSVYPQKDKLEKMKVKAAASSGNIKIKQDIYTLDTLRETYDRDIGAYLKNKVTFLSLRNMGFGCSLAWYNNINNLSQSWFIKFPLLHFSSQWIGEIAIQKNAQETYTPSSKLIRTNIFTIICGVEIGYAHVSVEFFINLTPTLNDGLTYSISLPATPNKHGKNLYYYGFIIKYNYF